MKRHLRSIVTVFMATIMALSFALAPAVVNVEAKTAHIDPDVKKVTLYYSPYGNSAYMSNSFRSFEGLIYDAKKNAKYTVKFKKKGIAKTVKNTLHPDYSPTLICAKGVGTTKAIVYEKVGKKKKTKIGSFKVVVKSETMEAAAFDCLYGDTKVVPDQVWLKYQLGMTTYDYADLIQNHMLKNSETGAKFNKSDYSLKFNIECIDDYETEFYAGDFEDAALTSSADASSNASANASANANASSNASTSSDANASTDANAKKKTDPADYCAYVDDKGMITANKVGNNVRVNCVITFKDKTELEVGSPVKVTDTSIEKAGLYNINNIRDYIVGLNTEVPLGDGTMAPQIGFDNAATTPAFTPVAEAVNKEMEIYGSIGRGFSQKSDHCTDVYTATRDKVIDFLGADPETYTCFYVNSTTDGLNKLASALVESKDDMVLTTRIEHHANDLSWRNRCKVVYAEVDDKGRVIYSDIEKLLKKNKGKIKIVSISAASNVTGYVQDVHKVAKMAHKYGAKLVVDGAQIVAHRKFSMIGDVNDTTDDVDFIAFSAHKMYSPYGGGAVVGLSSELNKHLPTFYGGGTVKLVGDDWEIYKVAPATYEAGSPNYPGVVGLGKAIDVISDVGFDDIQKHEYVLNKRLIEGLKKLPNVIIYGDTENIDDKVGVVTFNFSDVNTYVLAEKLKELAAVATRRGSFCSHPYVWRLMGIPDEQISSYEGCTDAKSPGMLRISFGIYNTEEEVDKLLEILPKAMEETKAVQDKLDTVPEF
ncbi:MAG: aminotransferase class V-fold PLP-dependent enzyme [Lachnospiraceae bacterium]|nr:aminotransferase class V-fold PLP-dependent enzyme [Lachnospiraceae bacterium]